MKMRIKSHVGCCFLMATNKAIFKPAYLTPEEKENEEHFRELMKLKEVHKHHFFTD